MDLLDKASEVKGNCFRLIDPKRKPKKVILIGSVKTSFRERENG